MAVFIFLTWVAAGLIAALAAVRIGPEGSKFFLFNSSLALVGGGTALGVRLVVPAGSSLGAGAPLLATAAAVFGVVAFVLLASYLLAGALGHDRRGLVRASAAAAAMAVLADAGALHGGDAVRIPGSLVLHLLNALSSGWLSGSILLAMILGHFYLVIPGLSIAPLRGLFRLALAGLAVRIVLVTLVGVLWWPVAGAQAFTVAGFLHEGVFVLQRVLFGLVLPASLAGFTWKTIEMRSTQSATGILYVVVFLTLVGEALSVYLSLETGLPI